MSEPILGIKSSYYFPILNLLCYSFSLCIHVASASGAFGETNKEVFHKFSIPLNTYGLASWIFELILALQGLGVLLQVLFLNSKVSRLLGHRGEDVKLASQKIGFMWQLGWLVEAAHQLSLSTGTLSGFISSFILVSLGAASFLVAMWRLDVDSVSEIKSLLEPDSKYFNEINDGNRINSSNHSNNENNEDINNNNNNSGRDNNSSSSKTKTIMKTKAACFASNNNYVNSTDTNDRKKKDNRKSGYGTNLANGEMNRPSCISDSQQESKPLIFQETLHDKVNSTTNLSDNESSQLNEASQMVIENAPRLVSPFFTSQQPVQSKCGDDKVTQSIDSFQTYCIDTLDRHQEEEHHISKKSSDSERDEHIDISNGIGRSEIRVIGEERKEGEEAAMKTTTEVLKANSKQRSICFADEVRIENSLSGNQRAIVQNRSLKNHHLSANSNGGNDIILEVGEHGSTNSNAKSITNNDDNSNRRLVDDMQIKNSTAPKINNDSTLKTSTSVPAMLRMNSHAVQLYDTYERCRRGDNMLYNILYCIPTSMNIAWLSIAACTDILLIARASGLPSHDLQILTAFLLLMPTVLGIARLLHSSDMSYGLTLVWALLSVAFTHPASGKAVKAASVLCVVLLLPICVLSYKRRHQGRFAALNRLLYARDFAYLVGSGVDEEGDGKGQKLAMTPQERHSNVSKSTGAYCCSVVTGQSSPSLSFPSPSLSFPSPSPSPPSPSPPSPSFPPPSFPSLASPSPHTALVVAVPIVPTPSALHPPASSPSSFLSFPPKFSPRLTPPPHVFNPELHQIPAPLLPGRDEGELAERQRMIDDSMLLLKRAKSINMMNSASRNDSRLTFIEDVDRKEGEGGQVEKEGQMK